jgi:hypothetical protein
MVDKFSGISTIEICLLSPKLINPENSTDFQRNVVAALAGFFILLNPKFISLNQRFYSLDVFRGATVCLMILVNNPGSWGHIYPPLEHAPWHGLTPTDLVCSLFFCLQLEMHFPL